MTTASYRVAAWAAIWALGGVLPSNAAAQRHEGLERSMNLIVGVQAPGEGGERGAGIVIGADGDAVLVATVCHLVYRDHACTDEKPDIQVWLRGDTAGRRARTVAFDRSRFNQDVAYLLVRGVPRTPRELPFQRARRGASLRRGTEVYPIGCAGAGCWELPVDPGRVASTPADADADLIFFLFNGPQSGYSGGGLFTRSGELVGMMLAEDESGKGLGALPIDTILSHARSVDSLASRVDLAYTRTPLQGYGTKISVAPVFQVSRMPEVDMESGYYLGLGGIRVAAGQRVRAGLFARAGAEVAYAAYLRQASVFVGAEVEIASRHDRERLPYTWLLHVDAVATGMAIRRAAGYYWIMPLDPEDVVRRDEIFQVLQRRDTWAMGPRAGLAYEVVLRPGLSVRGSIAATAYPWVAAGFPREALDVGVHLTYAIKP